MEARTHRSPVTKLTSSANGVENTLAQTTLLLAVLADVNSLMSKHKSFEEFCVEVGRILKDKFRFRFIDIWIRDERDPGLLKLVTPEAVNGYRETTIHQGLVGKCIREGKTVCVPDVSKDPDYNRVHPEILSELCVPLMSDGNSIGVINIETETPQTFQQERAVIELIAENLGHSLHVALLYRTEEQFHHLVEEMSEGVWVGDSEERTLYVNPALIQMMGFNNQELLEKKSYDMFDPSSTHRVREETAKRRQGIRSSYEVLMISKTGERIPVIIRAVPFGHGGSMSTITDLRSVKNAERKLVQAEKFLASITQYCVEAIVGFSKDRLIQSWNRGAEHMFGYRAEEVIGMNAKDLIIPEDRIQNGEHDHLVQEAIAKGFVRNFETIRLHKNKTPITVSLSISSLRDVHGNLMGFSALYRDITAQKKWERELQDRFDKMQDAYKEMGKQRRYLDYLIEMIHMAGAQNQSRKHISMFIANAIMMITKVDAVTMRLLDHGTGKLILTSQNGLGEEWWGKKAIPYSGSVLEKAVNHHRPLKILDILSDPSYNSPALARKSNLRSSLVIPLEAKGEVLGSLTLYLSQDSDMNLLDDEFIEVFARQAALALKLAD